jgi:hypothetical protein
MSENDDATPAETWEQFGEEQEYDDDRPAITFGDLRAGESVTITFDAEPEPFHSDEYGPGVRADATLVESDYTYLDEDGDEVEGGDEVTLVTWSKRLVRALKSAKEDADGIVGETVEITKFGSGYSTDYDAVLVDE